MNLSTEEFLTKYLKSKKLKLKVDKVVNFDEEEICKFTCATLTDKDLVVSFRVDGESCIVVVNKKRLLKR